MDDISDIIGEMFKDYFSQQLMSNSIEIVDTGTRNNNFNQMDEFDEAFYQQIPINFNQQIPNITGFNNQNSIIEIIDQGNIDENDMNDDDDDDDEDGNNYDDTIDFDEDETITVEDDNKNDNKNTEKMKRKKFREALLKTSTISISIYRLIPTAIKDKPLVRLYKHFENVRHNSNITIDNNINNAFLMIEHEAYTISKIAYRNENGLHKLRTRKLRLRQYRKIITETSVLDFNNPTELIFTFIFLRVYFTFKVFFN